MTLLDKIKYTIKSGLMLCALIPFFFGCDDPDNLGLELENNDPKTFTGYRAFSLPAYTVYIDSLRTDTGSKLIAGQIQDDSIAGHITASAFFNYSYPGTSALPDMIDSSDVITANEAYIQLSVSKSLYNYVKGTKDINYRQIDLKAVQASEQLSSSITYLSSHRINHSDDAVGTLKKTYSLENDTILRIPLDESFVSPLFARLLKAADTASANDTVRSNLASADFPAMGVLPNQDENIVFSFDLSDALTGIYFTFDHHSTAGNFNDTTTSTKFSMGRYYSAIDRDRSGTTYEGLTASAKNMPYDSIVNNIGTLDIFPLAGYAIKVNFQPYLDFLSSQNKEAPLLINKALLSTPIVTSSSATPIENITYYKPTSEGRMNTIIASPRYYMVSNINARLTAALVIDDEIGYYENDITLTAQALVDETEDNDDFSLKTAIITSTDQLDIGHSVTGQGFVLFEVTYTELN